MVLGAKLETVERVVGPQVANLDEFMRNHYYETHPATVPTVGNLAIDGIEADQ